MEVGTYNEHSIYLIGDVDPLLNALERFVSIGYDEISVAFVSEATICKLHAQFLNNEDPTDVITFPADKRDFERSGEICISVDEALKYVSINALADELTLYLVHGWLHLAGYDDIEENDRLKMRQMEQAALHFLDGQVYSRVKIDCYQG